MSRHVQTRCMPAQAQHAADVCVQHATTLTRSQYVGHDTVPHCGMHAPSPHTAQLAAAIERLAAATEAGARERHALQVLWVSRLDFAWVVDMCIWLG